MAESAAKSSPTRHIDRDFSDYLLPFETLNPIVGLAWRGNRLYGVEIFPIDNP